MIIFQKTPDEDSRSLEDSGGQDRSPGGQGRSEGGLERSSRGLVPQLLPNYTVPELPDASEVSKL